MKRTVFKLGIFLIMAASISACGSKKEQAGSSTSGAFTGSTVAQNEEASSSVPGQEKAAGSSAAPAVAPTTAPTMAPGAVGESAQTAGFGAAGESEQTAGFGAAGESEQTAGFGAAGESEQTAAPAATKAPAPTVTPAASTPPAQTTAPAETQAPGPSEHEHKWSAQYEISSDYIGNCRWNHHLMLVCYGCGEHQDIWQEDESSGVSGHFVSKNTGDQNYVEVKPTCTEAGYREFDAVNDGCDCGEIKTTTQHVYIPLPALGHGYNHIVNRSDCYADENGDIWVHYEDKCGTCGEVKSSGYEKE